MRITDALTKRTANENRKPIRNMENTVKGAQSVFLDDIKYARDTNKLAMFTGIYLKFIYEEVDARGESYGETANRLGGDAVLEAAEAKWFKLGC